MTFSSPFPSTSAPGMDGLLKRRRRAGRYREFRNASTTSSSSSSSSASETHVERPNERRHRTRNQFGNRTEFNQFDLFWDQQHGEEGHVEDEEDLAEPEPWEEGGLRHHDPSERLAVDAMDPPTRLIQSEYVHNLYKSKRHAVHKSVSAPILQVLTAFLIALLLFYVMISVTHAASLPVEKQKRPADQEQKRPDYLCNVDADYECVCNRSLGDLDDKFMQCDSLIAVSISKIPN